MTFKEFFSFKKNKMFWLNIAGMILFVAVLIFGTLKWLDSYTRHGEGIKVPDMTRMSIDEAERLLTSKGLEYVVTDSSYMSGVPAFTIIQQTPAAGKIVKQGRTVYLTVSTKRIPMKKIPDIINNSSLREAEARLNASGFKVTDIVYEQNEAKDWVLGLEYRGKQLEHNAMIPEGSSVVLIVGDGLEVDTEFELDTLNDDNTIINDENSWF